MREGAVWGAGELWRTRQRLREAAVPGQQENGWAPRNKPCPFCAENYTCASYTCPPLQSWAPWARPQNWRARTCPQSLGAEKHPLSKPQILVPRKEETDSLEGGRNHFAKEFELYVPKEIR